MQKEIANPYRIGELAKRAGKTVRTIHFYEELGLLQPSERSPGGFRMYTDDALERIHWIEQIQHLGFSLTDIRTFLEGFRSHETGPESMTVLHGFYQQKLVETRETIERMKALESELESSLQYLEVCQECTTTSGIDSCAECDNVEHSDGETPCMVAAIATSA
jgi:DNA-binding transcriptional MerR regulator